jgi:glycosidase
MHRYFDFMPDLNITEPSVLDEMHKVLGFWLELGISGFRVDSLQFMIETVGTNAKDQPVTLPALARGVPRAPPRRCHLPRRGQRQPGRPATLLRGGRR